MWMTKTTVFFYVGKTSFKSAWKVVFCFSCFYFYLFLRLFFLIFLFVFLLISFHSFVESVISFLATNFFFRCLPSSLRRMHRCSPAQVGECIASLVSLFFFLSSIVFCCVSVFLSVFNYVLFRATVWRSRCNGTTTLFWENCLIMNSGDTLWYFSYVQTDDKTVLVLLKSVVWSLKMCSVNQFYLVFLMTFINRFVPNDGLVNQKFECNSNERLKPEDVKLWIDNLEEKGFMEFEETENFEVDLNIAEKFDSTKHCSPSKYLIQL